MKNFSRILSVLLVLIMMLSALSAGISAAEFEDYYESPDFLVGDADFDNRVSVKDATAIQKHLAKIITLCEESLYLGDVDGNGKVNISDATCIQKYVAKMIDVFPVEVYVPDYAVMADGKAIEVEIPELEFADVMVTVEEAGYYVISATTNGEAGIMLSLTDEAYENEWIAKADGETYYIVAKLEKGVYFASLFTDDGTATVVSFLARAEEYKPPYNFEAAAELKIGDRIDIKATDTALIYKLDLTDAELADDICIYTKGTDSRTNLECFDSNFICVDSSEVYENADSLLYVYADSAEKVYYIVVTQEKGGSDFTLCCDTNFGMMKDDAKVMSVGTVDECEIIATFDEEEIDGDLPYAAIAQGVYLFTPEISGYYSFNFVSDANISVIGYVQASDYSDDSYLLVREGLAFERVFDVLYLEEGNEYLVVCVAMMENMGKVEFSILESDEEEYNEAQGEGIFDDATPDEADYKEIKAGESVKLYFDASTDEAETVDFKFTAEEDCEIVIFSEGSEDGAVYIMNDSFTSEFLGDEIITSVVNGKTLELFRSSDFAVKGKVLKGETIYMSVRTFAEKDSFTFSVVNSADYEPIS